MADPQKPPHDPTSATNQDFIDYDQVDKNQRYLLAEHDGAEPFDDDIRIQTCDFGRFLRGNAADRCRCAAELGEALQDIGFAIVVGTGIDPRLYDAIADQTLRLFESTAMADKLQHVAQRHGSVNQGYFPVEGTSDMHPDLVEGWVFCRRAFDLGQPGYDASAFWPAAGHEPVFRRLCMAHHRLAQPVAQAIMTALGQDPHAFDDRLRDANFGLRLNYYPPIRPSDHPQAGRLLGHEDVNLFTLLPAPTIEGLQVLNRRNLQWIRLQAPPGSIILNTGDYMQRITNDRLPSTTHRVSRPRDPADQRRPRVSFPLNVYLDENEVLEVLPGLGPPKYPPIEAITFHTRTTAKHYGDDYRVE